MSNSIQCAKCEYWVHKICSGIKGKLRSKMNYECCSYNGDANDAEEIKCVKFSLDEIKVARSFVIWEIC